MYDTSDRELSIKTKETLLKSPHCQSLLIPLCILNSSYEITTKESRESDSQRQRRITVTVRGVNSLQITPLSPPTI